MTLIATDNMTIVVGLGKTGLSCARYLARQGRPFAVADSRDNPPGLEAFRAEFPEVLLKLGELDARFLAQADELVVSPGLSIDLPAIRQAREEGVAVIGDIELFHRAAKAPIVAITGSNGKSTVTTLVGDMARDAGVKAAVGGNLGTPALDLLDDAIELYVLELSSFQLETTTRLGALAATVLNVSDDHMDRYADRQAYYLAKHRIFQGCTYAVVNRDDILSQPLLREGMRMLSFTTAVPSLNEFGVRDIEGEHFLAYGLDPLLSVKELKIVGRHNYSNALAALALGRAAGLPLESMVVTLKEFKGLSHRCQYVAERQQVQYVNDSKGTNVGATVAAIRSVGEMAAGKLVMILGGDGKGADFSPLVDPIQQWARGAILLGRDAELLKSALENAVPQLRKVDSLQQAVVIAAEMAQPGDVVLLSPACASLDMFKNYEDRGQQFVDAVNAL